MAIRRFKDYEKTKAYGETRQLPRGGYVLKVMGAQLCENSNGEYIKISCDIAEGEYAGFFAEDYRSQQAEDKKWRCNYLLNVPKDDGTERDGWTKRRFKTVIEALEESNPGYHFDWDEQKFRGKWVGGLFNEREYEGSRGEVRRTSNLAQLCTAEKVRKGNYVVPEDKLLAGRRGSQTRDGSGFMGIPEGAEEALPFD